MQKLVVSCLRQSQDNGPREREDRAASSLQVWALGHQQTEDKEYSLRGSASVFWSGTWLRSLRGLTF